MKDRILLVLGTLWALPITLVCIWYALACWALGWYRFIGWRQRALVWCHSGKPMAGWMTNLWKGWDGHSMGSLVVVRKDPSESDNAARMLTHELEHTRQANILGVFHPVVYGMVYVSLKLLGDKNVHPYYDNPFEVAARREAKQPIDIWGVMLKIRNAKK